MSEAKHTPGPWIWADHYQGLYGAGKNNEVLDYISYEGMWVSEWSETGRANASLISAAPDMLAALEAVELARHTDAEEDWLRATRLTDEALAKAKASKHTE